MKIAMIYDMIYPFNVGGGEARNYYLAKELIRRGHEVHFFGAKLWEGKNTINYDGIIMHGVYKSKKLYKTSRRSYNEPIVFALKLIKPLFKEKFDLIDCTAFPFFHSFVCKAYSKIKRVPLILTWHEVWFDYWNYYLGWKGFIGKWTENIVSKLSKNHIAVSEKTKIRLLHINKKANVEVVPNSVDLKLIESVKPSEEKYDLMFCGRLLPHKKVNLLIKAVRFLKNDYPEIKCLIIGKGPEKKRLMSFAEKIDVSENIVFKDFLPKSEDVYAYMKSSKIFVFPSILEGFGIVVIEAMACGIPIIGVKHKWNASEDLINENKAGFVTDISSQEIAEKAKLLLKNNRNYTKFSKNNKIKAKKYQIEKVADKIEKIYLEVSK